MCIRDRAASPGPALLAAAVPTPTPSSGPKPASSCCHTGPASNAGPPTLTPRVRQYASSRSRASSWVPSSISLGAVRLRHGECVCVCVCTSCSEQPPVRPEGAAPPDSPALAQ
eukprot:4988387-Alexandrium_andersonii.AAC.1